MRFSQLRLFLAVVESGSIRGAARTLGVTPPAVTKGVRQLEQDLHAQLLERTRHGVVVSPAGRALSARARVIESELRKVEEDVAQAAGQRTGTVAFGVGPTAMELIVPEAVVRFRQHHPGIRIRISQGSHRALLPLVRDETLDFALGLRPEAKLEAGIGFRPLFRHDFVVAARKSHPLRNARTLQQLLGHEWLAFAPRVSPGGVLERMFIAAGLLPPPVRVECDSLGGVVAIVGRTDMLVLISRRMLGLPPACDSLVEIAVAEVAPSVAHGIYTRVDTPLTRSAAALAKIVSGVARGLT